MGEEVTWDIDRIDMGIKQARLYADPSLENAYNSALNFTIDFWKKLKGKYKFGVEDHVVIFIYGQQGLGKSSVAIEILEELGIFTVDNIGFSNDEVMEAVRLKKASTVIMRDESIDVFGVGSRRMEATIGNTIETCRKAGLSFLFLRPTYEHIDGVHFVLEVLQRNNARRITHCALRDLETNYCIGFVLFNIKETNNTETPELIKHKKLWDEYIEKKNIFIDKIREQQAGGVNIGDKAEYCLQKLKECDPEGKIYIKMGERFLFIKEQFPNYTTKELELIKIKMEMLRRIEREAKEKLLEEERKLVENQTEENQTEENQTEENQLEENEKV